MSFFGGRAQISRKHHRKYNKYILQLKSVYVTWNFSQSVLKSFHHAYFGNNHRVFELLNNYNSSLVFNAVVRFNKERYL